MRQIKTLMRPVVKEFHTDKCGFNHTPADDFVRSQWQSRRKSVIYLIYRWILGFFFLAVVIQSLIDNGVKDFSLYFIYLTNWGAILCMLTNLLGATMVTMWHFYPKHSSKLESMSFLTIYFKVYWAMHIITMVSSIVITTVYWSILYNAAESELTITNVLTHAFNAAWMLFDLLIVAYPIRLLHIFLPVLFGLSYVVFTIIYYAAGGLNKKGHPYIYTVLDWSKPESAALTVIGVLILTSFVYMCIFMIYKLRIFIYRRLNQSSVSLPTTQPNSRISEKNDGVTHITRSTTGTVVQHSPSGISMVLGNHSDYDNRGFVEEIIQY